MPITTITAIKTHNRGPATAAKKNRHPVFDLLSVAFNGSFGLCIKCSASRLAVRRSARLPINHPTAIAITGAAPMTANVIASCLLSRW